MGCVASATGPNARRSAAFLLDADLLDADLLDANNAGSHKRCNEAGGALDSRMSCHNPTGDGSEYPITRLATRRAACGACGSGVREPGGVMQDELTLPRYITGESARIECGCAAHFAPFPFQRALCAVLPWAIRCGAS